MTRRGPAYGPGDATRQSPGTHAQLTLLEGLPVNLVTIAGQDADGCIEVYGMHVVVVLWCSTDGSSRTPVAFRLWRPKRSCTPGAYQTKLQLAAQLLTELVAARLPFQNLVTDTHYTAGWFPRLAGRLGIYWVGTLPPKTTVIWRGRPQSAAELAERLRLAWRPRLGLRATAVTVYAPTYGPLRLVVTRNRHGNLEPVVTSDLGADLNRVVERKHSRWSVETIFRTPSSTPGWAPASATATLRWSAMWAWCCSASSSCNSCVPVPAKASPPSSNDGS